MAYLIWAFLVFQFLLLLQSQPITPTFPILPKSYSSYVSATIGQRNYTLAYKEYYDTTLNVMRTEGRFGDYTTTEVFNLANQTYFRFNDSHCERLRNLSEFVLWPSLALFPLIDPNPNKTYMGLQMTRNTICYVWQSTFGDNMTANYSVNYYFGVTDQLPLRVVVDAYHFPYNGSAESRFSNVYDWISMDEYPQNASIANLPRGCRNAPVSDWYWAMEEPQSFPISPIPTNWSAVAPPHAPLRFISLVESKLTWQTGYSYIGDFHWYVDLSEDTKYERVDCDSYDCPDWNARHYLTHYLANNTAIQFIVYTDGSCVRTEYQTNASSPVLSLSPFRGIRAGSLPDSIEGTYPRVYNGRELKRAVPADVFVSKDKLTKIGPDGDTYTFNASTYFFPVGWTFPGRPAAFFQDFQMPLMVVNDGVGLHGNVSTPYHDQWDFFYFINAKPITHYPDIFDPTEFNCPLTSDEVPDFPKLPTQYSVFVEATIGNNEYTLSYQEFYDQEQHALRTEGLWETPFTTDLLLTDSQTYFRWNQTDCLSYPNYPATGLLRPSLFFFNNSAFLGRSYAGKQRVRDILCHTWVSHSTGSEVDLISTFQVTAYFDVMNNLPLRVELIGTRWNITTDTNYTFNHNYDWMDWNLSAQTEILIKPSLCDDATPSEIALPDFENGNVLPPVEDPSHPEITLEFTTLVESKLDNVVEDNVDSNVANYKWYVESVDNTLFERVDCLTPYSCPMDATMFITSYKNTEGKQWIVKNDGTCQFSYFEILPEDKILSRSPFRYIRAGSLPSILLDDISYLDRTYQGRTTLKRGVMADEWKAINVEVENELNGGVFYFNSSSYYFPDGWSYPGLNQYWSGVDQFLISITNIGIWGNTSSQYRYNYDDRWDLYNFVPLAPTSFDQTVFNTHGLTCNTTKDENQQPASSPSQNKAALIAPIVIVLGLLFILLVVFLYQKMKNPRRRAHIELQEEREATRESREVENVVSPSDTEKLQAEGGERHT